PNPTTHPASQQTHNTPDQQRLDTPTNPPERQPGRGRRTRHRPRRRTHTLVLDLADLSSVRDAATRIAETETVDRLFNNAGVMNLPERRTTRDGLEMTVGTNHLGHFAFNAHLWPAVLRSPAPRVITVSAIAARWPTGRLDDLMSQKKHRPMTAYAKSKRANIIYTLELARRTANSPVTALAVHPGSAMTGLQQHGTSPLNRILTPIAARLLMGSTQGGAWPSLHAATSPHAQTGTFTGPAGRNQTTGTPQPAKLPTNADNPTPDPDAPRFPREDLATRYANHPNGNHRRPAAQDPTATPEPIENSEFTQVFQQLDDCED
ncbi:SDR family NAD(P)-dependent oxidoreductase, partial [Streptomyces tendae]|uniref:SDR family NAD(P)-dependent oxidoreductase n=1 Tax=Streptomyces tendae TaxID=1932 RepID=UPI0033C52DE9